MAYQSQRNFINLELAWLDIDCLYQNLTKGSQQWKTGLIGVILKKIPSEKKRKMLIWQGESTSNQQKFASPIYKSQFIYPPFQLQCSCERLVQM